jgi:hypothetical protein
MKPRIGRSFSLKLVAEPAIADKIRKMEQRVRWQDPLILEQGIDQTSLVSLGIVVRVPIEGIIPSEK